MESSNSGAGSTNKIHQNSGRFTFLANLWRDRLSPMQRGRWERLVIRRECQEHQMQSSNLSLADLGWKPFFEMQIQPGEEHLLKARVLAHHGSQVIVLTETGELALPIGLVENCGPLGVGDWIVIQPDTHRVYQRLERDTQIARKAAGQKAQEQIIAANIDVLFIVSSCNQDFNLSRLERYLAVGIESKAQPVVILTKADLVESPPDLQRQVESLHPGLIVETLDARNTESVDVLETWCRTGKTVAMVGSSGVGKSTLANSLGADSQKTSEIRAADGKGRHTTTARSMHRIRFGGWLIDNPGMREFQLPGCVDGVEDLFDDIVELSKQCRFRNCQHGDDAGCALNKAVEEGELEARRLRSFLKLRSEQARNSESMADRREKDRKLGKFYKSVIAGKKKSREFGEQ